MKKYISIIIKGMPYRVLIDKELDKTLKYSLKDDYKFDNDGNLIMTKNTNGENYLLKQKIYSSLLSQIDLSNLSPELQERILFLKQYINLKKSDIFESDLTKLEALFTEVIQLYGTLKGNLNEQEIETLKNTSNRELYTTPLGKSFNKIIGNIKTNGFDANNINYYVGNFVFDYLDYINAMGKDSEKLFKDYFNGEKNDLSIFMNELAKYTNQDETIKNAFETSLIEQTVARNLIDPLYLNYVNKPLKNANLTDSLVSNEDPQNRTFNINYQNESKSVESLKSADIPKNNGQNESQIEESLATDRVSKNYEYEKYFSNVDDSRPIYINKESEIDFNPTAGFIENLDSETTVEEVNTFTSKTAATSGVDITANSTQISDIRGEHTTNTESVFDKTMRANVTGELNVKNEITGTASQEVDVDQVVLWEEDTSQIGNYQMHNSYSKRSGGISPLFNVKLNKSNLNNSANEEIEVPISRRLNGTFTQKIVEEQDLEEEVSEDELDNVSDEIDDSADYNDGTEITDNETEETNEPKNSLANDIRDKVKEEALSQAKKEISKELTKEAGKEAVKGVVAKEGGKVALGALLKNPYFWIVVGVIVLILLLIFLVIFIEEQYNQEQNNTAYNGSFNSNAYWWPIGSMEADSNGLYSGEPVSVKITSYFGPRDIGLEGASTNHGAIDIGGVYYNTPIIATKNGTVIKVIRGCVAGDSSCGGRYGNYVVIDHGNGITSLYAHMSSTAVNVGDTVVAGQLLGISGGTGNVSGPHLHFEIRINDEKVDPLNYVDPENPRPIYGSVNGISLEFVEFLHSWEGTGGGETDEYYVVYADPGGVLTVGYGVTLIYNEPLFKARGLNIDNIYAGDRISREVIDSIEYEILAGKLASVQNTVSSCGADLNELQIYALVSRMYNIGNVNSFCENYTKYGNTQALYDNYMKNPVTQDGKVLKGLIRRRAAEWELFSNGIYVHN